MRRRALWAFPSGIYLIGSRFGDEANLMTARWVTQVALKPKLVSVSVERGALTHRLIEAGGCFSVSLIRRQERTLARLFVNPARRGGNVLELSGVSCIEATTGAPIPASSPAWVDCRLVGRMELGSHDLFVGEVVDAYCSPEDLELLRVEDTRLTYGG